MKWLIFLVDLVCLPLEMLWKTGKALFASPWGLLIPLTLLAAFFLASGLQRNTPDLASHYADEWATCEEKEIPRHLDALLQMGDAGLTGLVLGLGCPREAVFHACHETLRQELDRWEALRSPESRLRHYRVFSETLLAQSEKLSPVGQETAAWFAHRILRHLASEKAVPGDFAASPDRDFLQATRNCEETLHLLDSSPRLKTAFPKNPLEPQRDTLARYDRRSFDPMLAYSGEAYGIDLDELNDRFATPRAERLYAYHQSPRFLENAKIPYTRPEAFPLLPDREELAGMPDHGAGGELYARNEKALAQLGGTLTPETAKSGEKVAADQAGAAEAPDMDFARDYLDRQGSAAVPGEAPLGAGLRIPETSDYRDVFISRELDEIPLDRISGLPSSQLMRLLHHSDIQRVNEARRTLISRDGFQEVHLKLAFRLFHPIPAVREELVSLLSETAGVRPSVWLTELLADPDKNVRYRAASFLATSSDISLQQLLMERGRRDRDQRIVDLSNKVRQQQSQGRNASMRR